MIGTEFTIVSGGIECVGDVCALPPISAAPHAATPFPNEKQENP
jgi:hypothetical protein